MKEMMHYMVDDTCPTKTKNITKYQKKATKKSRIAVVDFFINTFEIASPL